MAPGHVTEAEFWSSKRAIVRAIQSQANSQKIGLPSKLLGVLDAPVDARSGKVSISITPALERQIFAEYPAVAAMFASTVPHTRSRKQFFEEFIKTLKNRITRRRKRAAGARTHTMHARRYRAAVPRRWSGPPVPLTHACRL